jgi:hypothetical protein
VITGWARSPTEGVGFRADSLIMASGVALVSLAGCKIADSLHSPWRCPHDPPDQHPVVDATAAMCCSDPLIAASSTPAHMQQP